MPHTTAEPWQTSLYEAITRRISPEALATRVLESVPDPICADGWRIRKRGHYRSYMPEDFEQVSPLTRTANILAGHVGFPSMTDDDARNPHVITELCAAARGYIGAPVSTKPLDFRNDRDNREQRGKKLIDVPKRKYNRIFRMIQFLETENAGNAMYAKLCLAQRVAKSALATEITPEQFSGDCATAQFVAYMSARMNMRSVFTNQAQDKPFDKHAEDMLKVLMRRKSTDWMLVAHVFPRADVLAKLNDDDKVRLLAIATRHMHSTAELLAHISAETDIDPRKTVTVKAGDDSSSWNAAAGAWNKTRDWWVSLVQAIGMDDLLEEYLPGKTMRLMAADVVYWHYQTGGKPHPDTLVCAELPNPWDVVIGDATCTRADVVAACKKHGVDPSKSGWAAARPRKTVEHWRPTPELVHGVIVQNPELAYLMRKAGWFAGPAKYARLHS